MDENSNIKEKPKIGLFIIIGAIIILLIGCGLLFLNNDKKDNNQSSNTENTGNNVENKNSTNENMELDPPMKNNRKEISINDKTVQELYKKYHSSNNPVELSKNAVETIIYEQELFKETYFNNNLPGDLAVKIIDKALNNIKGKKIESDNYLNTVYEELEKAFKSFLGANNKYNNELFQCFEFSNNNGLIEYKNTCSDTSSKTAKYTITKAEKEEKYIYILEDVVIEDSNTGSIDNYSYRWSFESQGDGNYYILYVERM